MSDYQTMRDIGSEYGLSSHKLGRVLTDQRLRKDGRPTSEAFEGNWVSQRYSPDGQNYIWAWHVERTRSLLESLGYAKA